MFKPALAVTAFLFSAAIASAEETKDVSQTDFHKIATTYSEQEQPYNVDMIPAEAVAWIKAVYAADFETPAARALHDEQHVVATN